MKSFWILIVELFWILIVKLFWVLIVELFWILIVELFRKLLNLNFTNLLYLNSKTLLDYKVISPTLRIHASKIIHIQKMFLSIFHDISLFAPPENMKTQSFQMLQWKTIDIKSINYNFLFTFATFFTEKNSCN